MKGYENRWKAMGTQYKTVESNGNNDDRLWKATNSDDEAMMKINEPQQKRNGTNVQQNERQYKQMQSTDTTMNRNEHAMGTNENATTNNDTPLNNSDNSGCGTTGTATGNRNQLPAHPANGGIYQNRSQPQPANNRNWP